MNEPVLRCLNCDNLEYDAAYDVMGACEGNVFCPNCQCEINGETGAVHYLHHDDTKVQMCCVNTTKRFTPEPTKEVDKQKTLFG